MYNYMIFTVCTVHDAPTQGSFRKINSGQSFELKTQKSFRLFINTKKPINKTFADTDKL